MATITTTTANDRINMANAALVDFGGSLAATATNFSWLSGGGDVDINGSGFSYSGAGDARELSGGTITNISIDVTNDNGSETAGDFVITNTAAIVGSNIDKDNPRTFWNEVLKGNDSISLAGLHEALVGFGVNVIFGDDLSSATSLLAGTTDSGGNDTIFGTDNQFTLVGDVMNIEGFVSDFFVFRANYDAGNDVIASGFTDRTNVIVGDAYSVDTLGTLHGGNDNLDNSRSTSAGSLTVGDVFTQQDGTVNGGDDTITPSNAAASVAAGDVSSFLGGVLNGGDDLIECVRNTNAAGDARLVSASSATINGGNDEINGSTGNDTISGEVGQRSNTTNLITGGGDVVFGGGGHDAIFGEIAVGSLVNLFGGNDVLFGNTGNDTIKGQTGDDVLDGGRGGDSLDGGSGIDTWSFATAHGNVTANLSLAGFQNTGAGGFDRIAGMENVIGSNFNDRLIDNAAVNVLDGAAGNDALISGLGDDILIGGAGTDTADYSNSPASVTVNLATQTASGIMIGSDTFFLIENATGGVNDDKLTGNAGGNTLNGNGGNDTIAGGAGDDLLAGRDGDDVLGGNDGDDTADGGNGNDTVRGHDGDDLLQGGAGLDELFGSGDNDDLRGGADDDRLAGEAGDDTLSGDAGNDVLAGAAGRDSFIFAVGNQADTINGFADTNNPGGADEDFIDVQAYGFAGIGDIGIAAAGNDVVLTFAPGDTVRLNNYLVAHVIGDLAAEDFVF